MNSAPVRLAMLGMISENDHPYSWSAIINGFDPANLPHCPNATIRDYLRVQPQRSVGIPGAQVTHIWTDSPADAEVIARFAGIANVVESMEDVIGNVDAVIVATDDGTDHVRRVRPFVEAGVAVFVDKPLATTRDDLAQFIRWKRSGSRILSSSGLRYAAEIIPLISRRWDWITGVTCRSWERYGIHLVEPLQRIIGSGFMEVRCETQEGSDIVYLRHGSGSQATLAALRDADGSFGVLHAYDGKGHLSVQMADNYSAFRAQLLAVIEWIRNGVDPYPFDETIELMAVLIAAIESRRQGRMVSVPKIIHEIREN